MGPSLFSEVVLVEDRFLILEDDRDNCQGFELAASVISDGYCYLSVVESK